MPLKDRGKKLREFININHKLVNSHIVYLRHTAQTPDTLTVEVSAPNGQTLNYESKVIKVQEYTKDAIFRKKLLMYLPFYIMRYENELKTHHFLRDGAVAMILPLFGSKDEIFDLEASIAAFDPKAEILALIEFQKLADGDVFKKSSKTIRTRQRASAIVRRFL